VLHASIYAVRRQTLPPRSYPLHLPLQRDNEATWSRAEDERRKNVADERRRWAVEHWTHTGKPDVQRNQREAARRLRQLRAAAAGAAGATRDGRAGGGGGDGGAALAASYFSGAATTAVDGGVDDYGVSASSTARVTLGDADLLDLIRPLPTAPAAASALGGDPHQRQAAAQLRQRMRLYLTDYRARFGEDLLAGGSAWFPDDDEAAPAGGLLTGDAAPSTLPQLTDAAAGGATATQPQQPQPSLLPLPSPSASTRQPLFSPPALSAGTSVMSVSEPAAPTPTPSSAEADVAASLALVPVDSTTGALSSRSGGGGSGDGSTATVTVHGKSTTVRALFADALRREPDDELQRREAATDARLRQLGHRGAYRSLQEVAEQGRVARFDPTALAERHGDTALAVRSAVSGLSDDADDDADDDVGEVDGDASAAARRMPDYVRLRHHAAASTDAAVGGSAAATGGGSTIGAPHAITLPGSGGAMAAAAAVAALAERLRQRTPSRGGSGSGGGGGGGGGFATIGSSGVLTAAAERQALHTQEAAEYAVIGARVDHLTRQVAAVAGQAELQQYGALLRPLMDGVSRLMLNAVAADGTAAEVARVEAQAGQLTAARKARLEGLKAASRRQAGEGAPAAVTVASVDGSSAAASAPTTAATTATTTTTTTSRGPRRNSTAVATAPSQPPAGAAAAPTPPSGRGTRRGNTATTGTAAAAAASVAGRPPASAASTRRGGGTPAGSDSSLGTPRPPARDAAVRAGSARPPPAADADGGGGGPRAKTPTGLLVAAQAKLREAAAAHHGDVPPERAAGRTTRRGSVGGGKEPGATAAGVALSPPPKWSLVDELAAQKASLAQEKRRLGASSAPAAAVVQRRGTPR
jgi:trimeric autotransporter adhesin